MAQEAAERQETFSFKPEINNVSKTLASKYKTTRFGPKLFATLHNEAQIRNVKRS
jgi:hypothetical protein